jgi:hypothetical protein
VKRLADVSWAHKRALLGRHSYVHATRFDRHNERRGLGEHVERLIFDHANVGVVEIPVRFGRICGFGYICVKPVKFNVLKR